MADVDHRDDSWIGRRVGEYRRERNWTLATLAAKVGLSTTQLSRIESGARQASVGTLIEIAHAFGVSLSRLVDEQYTAPYHLTRAQDRIRRPSANGTLIPLSGDFPGLQAVHLTIPATLDASDVPDARHTGEEWLYVLTGSIDVRIGPDTATMAAGDAIHFPSHGAHRIYNLGSVTAEVLLVTTSSTG